MTGNLSDKLPQDNESDSWPTFKRLLSYLHGYKLVFMIAVIGNLAFAGMDYLFVRSLEPLTNEALVKGNMEFLAIAPFFIIGIIIIRGIANFISAYSMAWVGQSVIEKIRVQMVSHYMKLPSPFFDTHPSGTLVSKITFDTQLVANAITDAITKLLREGGLICYILYYLFSTSWQLASLFLMSAPIIGLVVSSTGKRFKKISRNIQKAMGGITQKTHEVVDGYKVIKTFGAEQHELNKFSAEAANNRQQNVKMVSTQSFSVAVIQLIAGLFLAFVLYIAGQMLAKDEINPGQFITMLSMMMLMLKPLKIISNLNSIFQTGIAAAQSVFAIIDEQKERDIGSEILASPRGKVEFRDVSFSYEKSGKKILEQISLRVEPGKTVALVGRSGSGKSTLTNLLLRFYDTNQGDILIDDISTKDLSLKSLRENISLVSQQVTLFNTSIAKNIAYAEEGDIDLDLVKDVARKAHAWEFIEKLPNGLSEVIGENGSKLSGGQRQRIAIARALYKDASIVILDEATSALDTESERHIQSALDSLTTNKTTIVVAHRLSTIENADAIVVLEGGKIIEQGSHEILLGQQGAYSNLYNLQFKEKH